MKKLLFTALLLLMIPLIAAFDTSRWQYEQQISIPPGINEPVKLSLETTLLSHTKIDGSDIRIIENGNEVAYKPYLSKSTEEEQTIVKIEASSTRTPFRSASFGADNLFDGDISLAENAYYQNDATIDPTATWLVVDLGQPKLTSKARFTTLDYQATFTQYQVEGSNDKSSWTMLKTQTNSKLVNYAPATFRYLRFTLWHTGTLIINELQLYGESSGYLLFFAETGKSYTILYGNSAATTPTYDLSQLSISATTPYVYATGEHINSAFNPDQDGDSVKASDNCPFIKNLDQNDRDKDGIGDACDNCVETKNVDQRDSDNDGFGDSCDNCAALYNPNQFDDNLNGIGYVCDDADGDRIINSMDNCVLGSNPQQEDVNRDYVGDVCEDADGDGAPNYADNCGQANPDQADADQDRIGDICDNCPAISNRDQRDDDTNGKGNACEDRESDTIPDNNDNCPNRANTDQIDWDKDSIGDVCDNCPNLANRDQRDTDSDGTGDVCDSTESRLLEQKNVAWIVIIAAVALIGGLAFWLYRSPRKS